MTWITQQLEKAFLQPDLEINSTAQYTINLGLRTMHSEITPPSTDVLIRKLIDFTEDHAPRYHRFLLLSYEDRRLHLLIRRMTSESRNPPKPEHRLKNKKYLIASSSRDILITSLLTNSELRSSLLPYYFYFSKSHPQASKQLLESIPSKAKYLEVISELINPPENKETETALTIQSSQEALDIILAADQKDVRNLAYRILKPLKRPSLEKVNAAYMFLAQHKIETARVVNRIKEQLIKQLDDAIIYTNRAELNHAFQLTLMLGDEGEELIPLYERLYLNPKGRKQDQDAALGPEIKFLAATALLSLTYQEETLATPPPSPMRAQQPQRPALAIPSEPNQAFASPERLTPTGQTDTRDIRQFLAEALSELFNKNIDLTNLETDTTEKLLEAYQRGNKSNLKELLKEIGFDKEDNTTSPEEMGQNSVDLMITGGMSVTLRGALAI